VEVAAALGEAEKRDLANALTEALYRVKHPVFDNPQLRTQPG
jgi:DNA-directed RNA polymerase subunit L